MEARQAKKDRAETSDALLFESAPGALEKLRNKGSDVAGLY